MTRSVLDKKKSVQKEKMLHTIIKRIIDRSNHRLELSSKHALPSKIFLLPITNKCVSDLLNDKNYFQSLNVVSSNSLITFRQQPEYLDKIINNQIYMYTENIFDFIEKYVLPHLSSIQYSHKDDIPWFLSLFHCTPWRALIYNLISSPIFISQQVPLISPIANTTSSIVLKSNCIEIIRHIPLDISKSYDISSIFIRQNHDLQILSSNLHEHQLLEIQNINIYLHECKDKFTQHLHAINVKALFLRDKIDKYNITNNVVDIDYTLFCDEKLKHLLSIL